MPLEKFEIPGGIVKDRSAYSAGGKWIDASRVRFQQGLPEPIGGWVKEASWSATGTPNSAIAWSNLNGDQLLALGTEKKIHLVFNDILHDITPIRESQSLTNPFTTIDETAVVTVADTGHGAEDGDYVTFSGASAVGGVTISGAYVLTYVDDNTFTITHSSDATSGATGGGSVTAKYQLSTGSTAGTPGLGWGISTWNGYREGSPITQKVITGITQASPGVVTSNGHGFSNDDIVRISAVAGMTQLNGNYYTVAGVTTNTFQLSGTNTSGFGSYSSAGTATKQFGWGSAAATTAETVLLEPSLWSFTLWGEDLIATRRDGGTFVWDATNGATTAAVVLSNAPTNALLSLVSVPDRHVICFGADNNPLLVKWSDQEDNATWSVTATNTAGSQPLEIGHKIIAATQTRDQILIFTDDALFGMVFEGPPYTFGFRPLARTCAPIGQNAVVEINGSVFWMGCGHFYTFTGRVEELPCPVRDHVFDNINEDVENITFGGLNRKFTEIWWFYATGNNTNLDSYVVYNYSTKEWTIGTLNRNVWIDDSDWLHYPLACDSDGNAYYHENGTSDNGSDISSFIECGAIEFGENGDKMLLVDKIIPDVSGSPQLTIYTRKYPNATEITKGPYDIFDNTEKLSLRAKGRQFRMKVSYTGTTYWRFGHTRFQFSVDGSR
tara:strand:+ start:348 stop:2348 length:2001 start_codon:yes stop_codon:yes gene_type:complete